MATVGIHHDIFRRLSMSLNSVIAALPTHQIVLPVSGMKVEYRPFVVKEEKILLMAAESKDERTMYNAVRAVVEACTGGKVNIMTLPTTDVEYLFLQLRSNSVGETATPLVRCEKCETPNSVEINLKSISPSNTQTEKKIQITDNIHVFMRYPTISDAPESMEGKSDIERALWIVAKCVDKVVSGETIYNTSELDISEVIGFVENLPQAHFQKLMRFVEAIPVLEKDIHFSCKKCQHENAVVLRGLANFF